MIINGARQVGKTYILRKFGEEAFENVVYINLETNAAIASYFNDSIEPERLLRYFEASTGQRIIPGQTLVILDEIQSCERALTALKYFCEEVPEYHIAAAGSLLGVAISREHYSFPVGKVETITLFPFDFEEYLWARGKHTLCDMIRTAYETMEPLPEALHMAAIELYREYLIIGGNEPSFSTARFSPEIAHRLRTAGSCECRRKDLRRSGIELRLPLDAPVEVGSQDVLRILGSECSFFSWCFLLVLLAGLFPHLHFRGNSCHIERHSCRVDENCKILSQDAKNWICKSKSS